MYSANLSALCATFALLCLSVTTAVADESHDGLLPLDESEMATVSGAEGVVLELMFRNNVNASLNPIGCSVSVGTPNPCRMGLEFAGRTGTWLMLKEYYGSLHLKDIRMDVAFLPATNTGFYNATRFQDGSGNNLIPGANPADDVAIKLSYPATDAQNTYDDLLSFLNIGRVWLEYDCSPSGSGATLCNPATSGYDRDTTNDSALSIRMSDSTALNAPNQSRFWGESYVFGF